MNLNIVPNGMATNLNGIKVNQLLSTVIFILLGVAGIAAFIVLLIGGLQWILSGGDKEGTEKARKRITAALVGLAIVFSAYALIFIISTLFGINITSVNIPTINSF